MKSYQAYLFDWDGTIARTLEVWLEVMREAFSRYSLSELSDDELVQAFGRWQPSARDYGVPAEDIVGFDQLVNDLSHAKVPYAPVYPAALETLEALKEQGKELALVTTDWQRNVNEKLAHNNLQGTFGTIISGDDVRSHKPDPQGILAALDQIGIEKDQAVMIGDSPHDLDAANNAGIDSVLFYPPSHQLFYELGDLQESQPTYIISDLHELLTPGDQA